MVSSIVKQMFRHAEILVKNSDPCRIMREQRTNENYREIGADFLWYVLDEIKKKDPKYVSKLEKKIRNIRLNVDGPEKLEKIYEELKEKVGVYLKP